MPNHSTILDSNSVIYLGHTVKQPLIGSPSELTYRLEPHDHIYSSDMTPRAADVAPAGERVYPGCAAAGWVWEGYTG